jgi:hypothetical protein
MDNKLYNQAIALSDSFWTDIYPKKKLYAYIAETGEDAVKEYIHGAAKCFVIIALETALIYNDYQEKIESMDIPDAILDTINDFMEHSIPSDKYETYVNQLRGIRDQMWGYCVKNTCHISELSAKIIEAFKKDGDLERTEFSDEETHLLYSGVVIAFVESVFRQRELRLMEGEYGS